MGGAGIVTIVLLPRGPALLYLWRLTSPTSRLSLPC
jgi:hypothetical protein